MATKNLTPEVTEHMLAAAMRVAVETGLVPKFSDGEGVYLKYWDSVEKVVKAALAAA